MRTKYIDGELYQVMHNYNDDIDDCDLCCFKDNCNSCILTHRCDLEMGIYFKKVPIVKIGEILYYKLPDYDDYACMRCDIKNCKSQSCNSTIYKIVEL